MRLRVLIADDDPTVRRVVAATLEETSDLELVGQAASAGESVEIAERLRPDVALIDVQMPGSGTAAARAIADRAPGTRVVAFSGREDSVTVRAMLDAGAVGYVVKGAGPDELVAAVRRAAMLAPRRPRTPVSHLPGAEQGVRVLVVHPEAHVLDAIADALDGLRGIVLVGLAQGDAHAASLAAQHAAQVALLPAGPRATRLTETLRAAAPGIEVTTVSVFRDHATALATAHERPDRYCLDTAVREELEREIREAALHADEEPRHLALRVGIGREDREVAARTGRIRRLLDEPVTIALQPIVHIGDGDIAGHEALARFADGRSPDVVFAEAARAGLGVELELHAVEHAIACLDTLPEDAFLSVNVSPDAVLDARLDAVLAGAPPQRLVLELTEHAPVHDYGVLVRRLDALRATGLRIAVDDCGAGFASLRHVVLLAPDFLKLDVVLCRDVRSPVRWAMARAIAGFAAETRSIAVAEGVESEADLEALVELGVPLAQGWLLGEPRAGAPERRRFQRLA